MKMIELLNRTHSLPDDQLETLLAKYVRQFLLITFCTTIALSFYFALIHHGWVMGDWLINYQGGVVRRGFIGEMVYRSSELIHVSPGFFVILLQAFFYGVFFFYAHRLLQRKRTLVPYLLLIFSPFIFTFQIYGRDGGFRKEIIFFAALAYAIYAYKTYARDKFNRVIYVLLLIYPALVLSHEMFAVFLPYLLVVFFYANSQELTLKSFLLIAVLLLPSIISFAAIMLYPGTTEQVTAIYQSLGNIGYALEDSSIDWLDKPGSYGIADVSGRVGNDHYLLFYAQVLVLSVLAYLPVRKHFRFITSNYLLMLLVAISIIGSILLCVVAIDWGRFIYINLVAFFLLSLLDPHLESEKEQQLYREIGNLKSWCKSAFNFYFLACFVLFYTQLWRIPHCCEPLPYSQVNFVSYFYPYIRVVGKLVKGYSL